MGKGSPFRIGLIGVSLAWRCHLALLLGQAGSLYASSANRKGETPAATAAQFEGVLGARIPILEDDPNLPQQSEAKCGVIVQVQLVRSGIQDELTGETGDAHVSRLLGEWNER